MSNETQFERAEVQYRRSMGANIECWWKEMAAGCILLRVGKRGEKIAWSELARASEGESIRLEHPTGVVLATIPCGSQDWTVGIVAVDGMAPLIGRIAEEKKTGATVTLQRADHTRLPVWS